MFVHYTKNTNTLSKIMSSGLFINQCERKLMHLFTNNPELIKRDPQFFGMTCVRHEDESGSKKHCDEFGYFGIILSDEWIKRHSFKPVIYIDFFNSRQFRKAFELALTEWRKVKEDSEDGFFREALFNKHMARAVGAHQLSDWLAGYEYMEKKAHKYQNEWRYVQPSPLYNNRTTNELLDAIQRPSWASMLRCLKIKNDDIVGFTTSKEYETEFTDWLVEHNIEKPLMIKEYLSGNCRLTKLW